MKTFIGVLLTVIMLTGATLTVLALWNIYPISWDIVWRSGVTISIVCISLLLLKILFYVFFSKDKHSSKGNNAHPMN